MGGLDVVAQADDVRFSIGVALQEAGLDENMTGREILATQGRLFGLNRAEIADRIEQLAPILEMRALDQLVSSYSGGMARRLDPAAALMHNPSVLFLDEPTTGLDPPSRLRVWEEVRRLNREFGLTLFLTTQYLEEADELPTGSASSTQDGSSPRALPASSSERSPTSSPSSSTATPTPPRRYWRASPASRVSTSSGTRSGSAPRTAARR